MCGEGRGVVPGEQIAVPFVHAEQVLADVLGKAHAVNQAGAAVVQEVIGRQAKFVKSVVDFPEPRIDTFTEDAVDLLPLLGLFEQDGQGLNGLLPELKRANPLGAPEVFVAELLRAGADGNGDPITLARPLAVE